MYKHKIMCYLLVILVQMLHFYPYEVVGNLQDDIATQLKNGNSTSLARTRRYLTFPAGSSFQLVFDLAYPSLDGIGFYVFGNTAALAWELPSTPIFLDKKFKKKPEPEPTTTMLPHLEHPEEPEHDLAWDDAHPEVPSGWQNKAYNINYHSKFGNIDRSPVSSYTNPFASYSRNKGFNPSPMRNRYPVHYVHQQNSNRKYASYWDKPGSNFWPASGNQYQSSGFNSMGNKMDHFDRDLHHNIHRRTRRDLYVKLEEFLAALIKDGKSCIMKTICQVNKSPKGKGTLFEELLKTVFKVKPDDFYENEDRYDQAANPSHDCEAMYPECEGNVLSKVLKTVVKK